MDINTLRIVVTVSSLLAFLGIVGWAYAGRNKQHFDALAVLPPDEEDQGGRAR